MEAGMKTDRLTLMVSPADKAAINARATSLGISVSELVRQAALGFDPEEVTAKAELEVLMPEFEGAVDRILASLDRMLAKGETHEAEMARLRSPEYREQVRCDVEADPRIDWEWIAKLRGGALHAKAVA
jgi:uncharacterized protein (DUF1778 family)